MSGLKLVSCAARQTAVAAVILLGSATAGADWPPAPRLQMPDTEAGGVLPPSILAERDDERMWNVTFEYRASDTPQTVNIAGTFNGWSPRNKPMTKREGENAWRITLLLGSGDYQYKFVRNGGDWVHDARNPETTSDGQGGSNSILRLGKLASMKKSPAKPGDGQIEVIGLHHERSAAYFQPMTDGHVLIRYRTMSHDVDGVSVALHEGPTAPMHVELQDDMFATWEALVRLPSTAYAPRTKEFRQVTYTFVLSDGGTRASHPTDFTVTFKEDDLFETPQWARHAIWYQIMPDRFRNGNPDNDPEHAHPWTSDWFEPTEWEGQNGETFYKSYVFRRLYGGDIDGVEEKLPYLKELGVNAIYFNPVFQSISHHKYNASNYLHVDEQLGGGDDYDEIVASEDLTDPSTWKWTTADKRFLAFIKKSHEMGIRVIIDGVFNHVGTEHPAFQDVRRRGKQSKYADWFEVTRWEPFTYAGWAGHDSLPVFRKSEDGLASRGATKHIFDVTRRWMDPDGDGDPGDGIDGWRLDVPNEIAAPFWVEWRAVVKAANPDAYITGEIWDNAAAWLDGEHFDAVMNYQFAHAAVAWIFDKEVKTTASETDRRLAKLRMSYPPAATYVLQNLIASHDTDRVASMALNSDREYDRDNRNQDDNPAYNNDKPGPVEYARMRLITLLQMTYVGAPMIYYGDEVGMWGADDPTCRKPMLWKDLEPYAKPDENHVMEHHLAWFQKVIALRNGHPALRTGAFQTLLVDDAADVWAFARYDDDEQLIVALNASGEGAKVKIPLPADAPEKWRVEFSGGGPEIQYTGEGLEFSVVDDKLEIHVPALGGTVLESVR